MAGISATRFGGLILIIGALLAVVMAFLRPGYILIEPQSLLVGQVDVLAKYAELTHVSSLFGALGLLMMLFGFYTIRRGLGGLTVGDAIARFGVLLLTFGIICTAFSHGLNHMIAHVLTHGLDMGQEAEALTGLAIHLQLVKMSIRIIAGYGLLLGFALLSLGLYFRFPSGGYRAVALIIVLVSLVGLMVLVIGDHIHTLGPLYRVASLSGVVFSIWAAFLGLALCKEHPSLTPAQPEQVSS